MELLLIGLLVIGLFIGLFIWLKLKKTNSKKSDVVRKAGFGIPMTKEEDDLERQSNDEVLRILQKTIEESGFFVPEKIPELMARLKDGQIPFGRGNSKVAFDGDRNLSIEDKKALGLNSRMKYSAKFIGYFNPASFKTIEPKRTLECMQLDAFHRVSRKKELLKLKKSGWIKQVTIVSCDDGDDCQEIKRLKKTYSIVEVPELPLAGCDAAFCRCWYQAVIPK